MDILFLGRGIVLNSISASFFVPIVMRSIIMKPRMASIISDGKWQGAVGLDSDTFPVTNGGSSS